MPPPKRSEIVTTPAASDVQAAISGPAVRDVETVFRERWQDPTRLSRNPLYYLQDRAHGLDLRPDPLPPQAPAPPPVPGGTHVVQLLRTYPNLRHGRDHPFARGGERSVARGYSKALKRAKAMDRGRLARAVRDFGSARAQRLLAPVLEDQAA